MKIVGGHVELPRKCVFFLETAIVQPSLGRQEVAVDDSGDDKGK